MNLTMSTRVKVQSESPERCSQLQECCLEDTSYWVLHQAAYSSPLGSVVASQLASYPGKSASPIGRKGR